MPRRIFASQQTQNSENGDNTIHEFEQDTAKILEKAQEAGNIQLSNIERFKVNEQLLEKLEEFTEYQEKLNSLMEKKASLFYEPFIIYDGRYDSGRNSNYNAKLYFNTEFISDIYIYCIDGSVRGILLQDFKLILTILGNKNAMWIKRNSHTLIDIVTYIVSIGSKISIEEVNNENRGRYDDTHYDIKIEVSE